jgi:2-C-methyl-D-erythritol 4-phosphate cytidylyltransferase
MKRSVVIVAGGSGSRMGSDTPKQFMELSQKPILIHTINKFYRFDKNIEIVLVLPEDQIKHWETICTEHSFSIAHHIVAGGKTRFHSVKNGVESLSNSDVIAIHDGVRPLVSNDTIERCYNTANETGSAIPVLPVTESLRKGNLKKSKAVDRTKFYSVQTPQTFRAKLLHKAYDQEWLPEFTDDASVIEKMGHPITMVIGNHENIKITHQPDLKIAEMLLQEMKTEK